MRVVIIEPTGDQKENIGDLFPDFLLTKGHSVEYIKSDIKLLEPLIKDESVFVITDFNTDSNYLDFITALDVLGIKRSGDQLKNAIFFNDKYLFRGWLSWFFPQYNPEHWSLHQGYPLIDLNLGKLIAKLRKSSGSHGVGQQHPIDIEMTEDVILESFITGPEFGVVFLRKELIGSYQIEIGSNDIFTSKMKQDRTKYYNTNKKIGEEYLKQLQEVANKLNLSVLFRFDVRIDEQSKKMVILEVNVPATCDYANLVDANLLEKIHNNMITSIKNE